MQPLCTMMSILSCSTFFEFANTQHLELQYFDRVLDKQLSSAYERKVQSPPLKAYLPFVGALANDPVSELGRLRVDISVVTERLENSVKLAGESYYAELYCCSSKSWTYKTGKILSTRNSRLSRVSVTFTNIIWKLSARTFSPLGNLAHLHRSNFRLMGLL